jgi:hypothetical protein
MENLVEKYSDALESKKFAALRESEKSVMATLLENTAKEAQKLISEGTVSGDIQTFTNILLPLVRRTHPNLIANALTGVAPLPGPTGYIYALTTRYTGTSDNSIVPVANAQILVTDLADASTKFTVGGDISTSDKKAGKVIYIEGSKLLVKNVSGVFAAGDAVDNANPFSAAETTVTAVFSNEATFTRVLKNYTGPVSTAVGEQLGTDMKELGITIARQMVETTTRKLKAKYTVEMFQDLQAVHGLNAENELMNLISYELQAELDREIVTYVNNTATVVSDATVHSYDGRWEIEKYRSLALKIDAESREIGRLTRRGAGNTLVVSPKVSIMLSALGGFILSPVPNNVDGLSLASQVGTFDGKYNVIVDNFAEADYVTTLYKGATAADNMCFYSPYVPVSFIKTVNPESGQPALIAASRYALSKNPLNPENYARTFGVSLTSTVLGA